MEDAIYQVNRLAWQIFLLWSNKKLNTEKKLIFLNCKYFSFFGWWQANKFERSQVECGIFVFLISLSKAAFHCLVKTFFSTLLASWNQNLRGPECLGPAPSLDHAVWWTIFTLGLQPSGVLVKVPIGIFSAAGHMRSFLKSRLVTWGGMRAGRASGISKPWNSPALCWSSWSSCLRAGLVATS